jgi:hypothetical protein
MSNWKSLLKLGPSCSKQPNLWFSFEKCIICQRNCENEVNIFTHNSKSRFLKSDEICNKFIDEYGSLDQIQAGDIQMVYHRICCKSYTSKHNIAVYVSRKCGTTGSDQDSTASTILTRSQTMKLNISMVIGTFLLGFVP